MSESEKNDMVAMMVLPPLDTNGMSKSMMDSCIASVSKFTYRFETHKLTQQHTQHFVGLLANMENVLLVRMLALNTLIGEGAIVAERVDKIAKLTEPEENPFVKP